jgi:hypothetical protein
MGMMAELFTVVRSYLGNRNGAGQTICIEATGLAGKAKRLEVFGQAGVFSRPPKGTRGIDVPLGREKIALAFHNYQIIIDWTDEGETTIFSTTADGATVKARIDLKADGNIYLNGTSKYLVTWGALEQALSTFLTALNAKFATKQDAGGAAGGLTLDISAAKATTLRTDG